MTLPWIISPIVKYHSITSLFITLFELYDSTNHYQYSQNVNTNTYDVSNNNIIKQEIKLNGYYLPNHLYDCNEALKHRKFPGKNYLK